MNDRPIRQVHCKLRMVLLDSQEKQKKTIEDIRSRAFVLLTAFILIAVIQFFVKDTGSRFLMVLAAAVLAILGIFSLLRSFSLKSEKVICPKCLKKYHLRIGHSLYNCPICDIPLFIRDQSALILLECPSCSTPIGIGSNYGRLNCGNCGAHTEVTNGVWKIAETSKPCPACGARISASVLFCPKCLHYFSHPPLVHIPNDRYSQLKRGFDRMDAQNSAIVEKLLLIKQSGMPAEVMAHLERIKHELDKKDPQFLKLYADSQLLDFAPICLTYSYWDGGLTEGISRAFRLADEVHARFLDLNCEGDIIHEMGESIKELCRMYLHERNSFLISDNVHNRNAYSNFYQVFLVYLAKLPKESHEFNSLPEVKKEGNELLFHLFLEVPVKDWELMSRCPGIKILNPGILRSVAKALRDPAAFTKSN